MKPRPKLPSLVSMWMLDVFCCALGCVTLLWLLNTREAGVQAQRAGSALERLTTTEQELQSTRTLLLATQTDLEQARLTLNAEITDLRGQLVAMTTNRDDTAKKLAVARSESEGLTQKLADSTTRLQELDDLLMRKQKDMKDLSVKLLASTTSAEELQKLLRQKEQDRADLAMKAQKAEDQLNDVDAKLRAMTKQATDAKTNLAAMQKSGDELAAAKTAIKNMQTQLDAANANIIDLQGDKAKLADKFDKLRADTENKFAGIVLTGKRVVFVVDISGSMRLIDDKTPAPTKWATVIETVGKVMRSLPDLERYQVVIFSHAARYLFPGGWQEYQGAESVKRVSDALTAIVPENDTNLYDALDLAFRFRGDGLDTVYLFSDGLPTSGPGLTQTQMTTLSNPEKSNQLARHIRQTLNTVWNRPTMPVRVKINSIGFFYESPDVGAFLWALTRENDGSFVGMSRP
ncbi:MAG: VWA domain-containing protein [Bacteroidales bacterium]|nr:VWA domain-containing protein [Bacteroidales bacterium]